MSDNRISAFLWAIGLIFTGILLLLYSFGLLVRFEPGVQYVAAICFALLGIGFFGGYLADRSMWWRIIPGWTLIAVAVMVVMSTLSGVNPLIIPAALFLGLALAFGNIYTVNRRANWWAVIPGGFMLVLSGVILLYSFIENLETLFALMVAGLGLVFLLLSILGPSRIQWWPLLPGLALLMFGLFILTGGAESDSRLLRWWPVALIVIGLSIGWRAAAHTTSTGKLSVNMAPGVASVRDKTVTSTASAAHKKPAALGEYSEPAPGASVEILSDFDDENGHNR